MGHLNVEIRLSHIKLNFFIFKKRKTMLTPTLSDRMSESLISNYIIVKRSSKIFENSFLAKTDKRGFWC